jgi:hypothetical protein
MPACRFILPAVTDVRFSSVNYKTFSHFPCSSCQCRIELAYCMTTSLVNAGVATTSNLYGLAAYTDVSVYFPADLALTGMFPTSTNICSAPSHYRTAGNTGVSATTIMQRQFNSMPTTGCPYSHNPHKSRSICTPYIPAGQQSRNATTATVRHSSTAVQVPGQSCAMD